MRGKIILIGLGPGAVEHMTLRAREAIAESDVVIGYSTYIKLVKDLFDDKQVIRKGMTEEIDRCVEAYEQAKQGKTVALVSSGDIGIYGMAGPTYEVLLKLGWTPQSDIEVEVVPGSTALAASASLVGAPLTHDFCSISLSDLLTPWTTIAMRLDAAASSDFVIALYNPKSGRRTEQIVEAQRIILKYRKGDTPVAIVRSAYRSQQNIQMVRLDEMKSCDIGMLTTVLIGNSTTFRHENLMITPRGYANKYSELTGDAIQSEKRGRSLSMGLTGWEACAREYIRTNQGTTLRDTAQHFNVSLANILKAVSEANNEDTVGAYSATNISQNKLLEVLNAAKDWGSLRAEICNKAGVVSELRIQENQLVIDGTCLKIENEYIKINMDSTQVEQIWFTRYDDAMNGIYFTDKHGEDLISLFFTEEKGSENTKGCTSFDQSWLNFQNECLA